MFQETQCVTEYDFMVDPHDLTTVACPNLQCVCACVYTDDRGRRWCTHLVINTGTIERRVTLTSVISEASSLLWCWACSSVLWECQYLSGNPPSCIHTHVDCKVFEALFEGFSSRFPFRSVKLILWGPAYDAKVRTVTVECSSCSSWGGPSWVLRCV